MLDADLTEALRRLDERLRAVCDEEEHRAALLGGPGGAGWDAVRNLTRPAVTELRSRAPAEAGLVPRTALPFRRFGAALGLGERELDVLLVLLAAHVEPRYQSLYAVLQDDLNQPRPTERLVHAVLGGAVELARLLGSDGRLVRAGLVVRQAGSYGPLARPLDLPEDAVAMLLGSDAPPVPGLRGWSTGTAVDGRPVPWQAVIGAGDLAATAREVAPAGTRLLEVSLPQRAEDAVAVAGTAWRTGIGVGALPVLDLSDVDERDLGVVAGAVETLVGTLGGRAWLLSRHPVPLPLPQVQTAAPRWAQRRDTWLAEASSRNIPLSPARAGELAARHRLDPPAVRRVLDLATSTRESIVDDEVSDVDAAIETAARRVGVSQVRHSTATVPRRGFDELVLRDTTLQALHRLVHYVRHRDQVAEDLGLEHRYRLERGPIALFSGLSGTGKTAAAEAVAAALERPLHTVDLARLVSKYIGETEKHVDEVMLQAERASAVLFFDEADALFASRVEKASSAGEQFTNMLVGYLLQRIELHDGPTVLATNLRHGVDEAFLRRFQFRIEFPVPEADDRQRIWELLIPPTLARAADVDLGALAKAHRLAGGDIRNAALKAVFLAHSRGDRLRQDDLERAVALELLEMGRLSRREDAGADTDRGRLLRVGLDDLHGQLEVCLRRRFLKEIHVVHGCTDDVLAGRRPAVSLALFRLAARRGAEGLRAGFIVSAWSHLPEEESELLGVVHEALAGMGLAPVHGREARLRVQESHDFDLLHRFWSSHQQPMRASVLLDVEID